MINIQLKWKVPIKNRQYYIDKINQALHEIEKIEKKLILNNK